MLLFLGWAFAVFVLLLSLAFNFLGFLSLGSFRFAKPLVMSSEEEITSSDEEEQVTDLRNSDVVTKYQEAAKIVNLTIKGLCLKCKAGVGTCCV